jgi:hypothetical protein
MIVPVGVLFPQQQVILDDQEGGGIRFFQEFGNFHRGPAAGRIGKGGKSRSVSLLNRRWRVLKIKRRGSNGENPKRKTVNIADVRIHPGDRPGPLGLAGEKVCEEPDQNQPACQAQNAKENRPE